MSSQKIEYHISKHLVLLPILMFLVFSIYLFVFAKTFDIIALALGAVVSIATCSFFSKTYENYWNGVIHGISTPLAGTVVVILFIVGLFSAMMKDSGVANGFAWLGFTLGLSGGLFCAFTFFASALLAISTGSSIGTLFTAGPILYPAGVLLGADPAMLAGAILSGAVFGDNLAPVSDVTILSVSTQYYKKTNTVADIGGAVKARFPFAILAGIISLIIFAIFGGSSDFQGDLTKPEHFQPDSLIMLIPVVILLSVAITTRNIFKAILLGTFSGTVIALLFGLFTPADVFSIKDGQVTGFLYTGFKGILETIILCLSLFGIMGIMEKSGFFEDMLQHMSEGGILTDPRKGECMIAFGSMLFTMAMAGVTSASIIMFGPTVNYIGQALNIHPYRRAYLLSGFANSLPVTLPFAAFNFIIVMVANQNADKLGVSVTPVEVMFSAIYPIVLFVIFMISIFMGIGRIKED